MDKILSVKIRSQKGNPGSCEFRTRINLGDYKQVAGLLNDLENFGAKINEAYFEFKRGGNRFPW